LLPFWLRAPAYRRARRRRGAAGPLAGIVPARRNPRAGIRGTGEESSVWDGRLSTRDNSRTLESVRVSGNNVHFEVPGEGIFDGAAAGDTMAGSVSGPVSGSFSLKRTDEDWSPYPFGP